MSPSWKCRSLLLPATLLLLLSAILVGRTTEAGTQKVTKRAEVEMEKGETKEIKGTKKKALEETEEEEEEEEEKKIVERILDLDRKLEEEMERQRGGWIKAAPKVIRIEMEDVKVPRIVSYSSKKPPGMGKKDSTPPTRIEETEERRRIVVSDTNGKRIIVPKKRRIRREAEEKKEEEKREMEEGGKDDEEEEEGIRRKRQVVEVEGQQRSLSRQEVEAITKHKCSVAYLTFDITTADRGQDRDEYECLISLWFTGQYPPWLETPDFVETLKKASPAALMEFTHRVCKCGIADISRQCPSEVLLAVLTLINRCPKRKRVVTDLMRKGRVYDGDELARQWTHVELKPNVVGGYNY